MAIELVTSTGSTGQLFYTGGAHHLIELAIGGMAYHRLDVASQEGLSHLLLCESLEVLADSLQESQSCMVLAHVNIRHAIK